ncbi:MAG: hypothetical protein AAF353_13845 [Pseudomonadota bacterium]
MPEDAVVEYEMGYSPDEFGKVLNGEFTGDKSPFNCTPLARYHWSIEHDEGEFTLEIEAAEQPPRKIALFSLPVLKVVFSFQATDNRLQQKFFHRFHQYFHKGGG